MPKRPNNPGDAWCSQHGCHPNDCFDEHNPEKAPGAISEKTHQELLIREHIRRQNEHIRLEKEKMDRSIVDARKRFEENRRKEA